MNKVIVIGNLGRDPEMRYLPSGQGVSNFSVASSRRYTTSSGEQREETVMTSCYETRPAAINAIVTPTEDA